MEALGEVNGWITVKTHFFCLQNYSSASLCVFLKGIFCKP